MTLCTAVKCLTTTFPYIMVVNNVDFYTTKETSVIKNLGYKSGLFSMFTKKF